MAETLFLQSLVVIVACAGLVFMFAKLRLAAVLGYLVAGVAIGPHDLGVAPGGEGVRFFGDLGSSCCSL